MFQPARALIYISMHQWLLWWLRRWSICLQCRRPGFDPWVGKILWRRKWQPTPVLLPGKSHGWRSVVSHSPWGHKESDMTERLHFHFHAPVESLGVAPADILHQGWDADTLVYDFHSEWWTCFFLICTYLAIVLLMSYAYSLIYIWLLMDIRMWFGLFKA